MARALSGVLLEDENQGQDIHSFLHPSEWEHCRIGIDPDRACTKKGLALEAAQYEKWLRQCEAELRKMDIIEACRADELREPEVNFDVEA